MKYTDNELEEILDKLTASTRSPRGRFSAKASYPQLEKQLRPRLLRLSPKRFVSVAAVILLCLSAWIAYQYTQPETIKTISTLAATRNVLLPDGTSVTLNHFSKLTYPEHFKSANREVTLNGEAYFEVSKDKKHPFIVQAGPVNVQVLGTHFNVEAYTNNPEVKATLLEGSVAVSNKENTLRLVLKPNEMAIYNKVENSLICKALESTQDEVAWKQGEFIFNSLPLKDIAQQLSDSYGINILIPDTALQNYCVTARFPKEEKLETILSVLRKAGYFDYSKTNNQLILTAKPD